MVNIQGTKISEMASVAASSDVELAAVKDGKNCRVSVQSVADFAQPDLSQLNAAIAAKQTALTTSADLSLTPAGLLSLTDMAKKRLFIDVWNTLCGSYGRYNPDTDFFELNGLTDITYQQAIEIVSFHDPTNRDLTGAAMDNTTLRTVIPRRYRIDADFTRAFQSAIVLESFATLHNSCYPINMTMAFWNCSKLKNISGVIAVGNCTSFNNGFKGCTSLEDVQFSGIKSSISFPDSPLLSLASLQYLVKNSANGSTAITVTVHPDVYAKLTDTANTEWNKVLTDAVAKNISFATV